MSRRRRKKRRGAEVEEILEEAASLLDLIDHVVTKGVMLRGEVMLGVANIDLIYLRLSALLCAADRVLARGRGA